jgi:TfoX/Sxy family transcriptional regulator of competence genes
MTPDDAWAELTDQWQGRPGVDLRRMMSSPGLTVNGSIFSMLTRGELVVKLPAERATAMYEAGTGVPFQPMASRAPMRQWVVLQGEPDPQAWHDVAEEAHAYVASLPAKKRSRSRR